MTDTMDEYSMSDIYRLGMDCLVERFGIVNMEKFLVAVKTNGSDYTWRRQDLFEDLTLEEFDASVIEYGKTHPKKAGRRKD